MKALIPRSKYYAVRTTVDGQTFASKRESRRYSELKLLEKAGEISDVLCQPRFPLKVHVAGGGVEIIGHFVADFSYVHAGQVVIEDVKGMRSLPLAVWKMKHFRAQYGIEVVEVR